MAKSPITVSNWPTLGAANHKPIAINDAKYHPESNSSAALLIEETDFSVLLRSSLCRFCCSRKSVKEKSPRLHHGRMVVLFAGRRRPLRRLQWLRGRVPDPFATPPRLNALSLFVFRERYLQCIPSFWHSSIHHPYESVPSITAIQCQTLKHYE